MVTHRQPYRLAFIVFIMLCPSLLAQSHASWDTIIQYNCEGTFYHDRFEGRKTANGETFNQNAFTAAHKNLKFGTMLKITNRNNGKQVIVKVNDRCPKQGVIDMSHRAAKAIGINGCQPVTIQILPNNYYHRRLWLMQETTFDSVHVGNPTKK